MKLIRLSIYVLMTIVFFTGMTSHSVLAIPLPIDVYTFYPFTKGYNVYAGYTEYVFGASAWGTAESLYSYMTPGANFVEGGSASLTTAQAAYTVFGASAYGEVKTIWLFIIVGPPGRPAQLMATWNTIMDDSSFAVIGTAGGSGSLQISASSQGYPLPVQVNVTYAGGTPPSGLPGSQNFGWLPVDIATVAVLFDARSDVSLPAIIGLDCMDMQFSTFNFKIWLDDGVLVPLPPSLFLLGTGLMGLAVWRRLRKG